MGLDDSGATDVQRFALIQAHAFDLENSIESFVECRDFANVVVQHHGGVDGVSNADVASLGNEILCTVRVCEGYWIHRRTQLNEEVVDLYCKIGTLQTHVAIKNLLEDLGAGAGLDSAGTNLLKKAAGRLSQGMIGPRDIHWDVRVDEDPHRRPPSISASTWSMSPVGAPRLERVVRGSRTVRSSARARSMTRRTHADRERRLRSAAFCNLAARLSGMRT